MVKPFEQGTTKNAIPLAKSETTRSLDRPPGQEREPHTNTDKSPLPRSHIRKGEPKSEIAEQIGQRLRGVYNEVLFQPVPERFHELMRALETASAPEAGTPKTSKAGGRTKDSK